MKLSISKLFFIFFFIKETTFWKENLVNSSANFLFLEYGRFIFISKSTFLFPVIFPIYAPFLKMIITLQAKTAKTF